MRALPVAILLALVAVAPAADDRVVVRTEHYEFSTAGGQDEADEFGRLLEAAWPQYAAFFGAGPQTKGDERLRVALFEDDPTWRAAIEADGGAAPDSGGYYFPGSRTAYLKRQPSVWYTRTLLLHEAAHQFHYLACTGNDTPGANWYIEGVAEHLGSHTWDGEHLQLGVTPLLSLEDRSAAALSGITAAGFSLAALLDADSASRPEAMFLVRYLVEEHAKKFAPLAKKLDRGTALDAKTFRRAFGKDAAFVDAWREWLRGCQEPLDGVFVEWDARAAHAVRGRGGVVSICRTHDPATRVAATVRRVGERALRAGVLVALTGPRDYVIAVVQERGDAARLQVDRMQDGKWTRLADRELGAVAGDAWRVAALRGEGGVTVTAARDGGDPATLGPFDVPAGPLGLVLDNCEADFTQLEFD